MSDMTAIVAHLRGPEQLAFETELLANPESDQIVCKTIVSAISPGTEVAAFCGLPPLRPGTQYPRVQGYCNVAEVLSIGAKIGDISVGDRVLTFTSHRSHFVVSRQDVLLKLLPDHRADDIVCSYLYHLGYAAVLSAGLKPGHRVAVLGLGTLGLCSVSMAALAGAQVVAVSDQTHARAIAESCGAGEALGRLGASDADLNHRFDVVISTTNGWSDWRLALELAALRSCVAVLGFPGRGQPAPEFNPLDSRWFYDKQITVKAVGMLPETADPRGYTRFNERENIAFIADQIHRGRLQPKSLVTGRYPAARLEDAYRRLTARDDDSVTFLLDW